MYNMVNDVIGDMFSFEIDDEKQGITLVNTATSARGETQFYPDGGDFVRMIKSMEDLGWHEE